MTQQWKVILAFAGIFVAGAVAGSVVALRLGQPAPVAPPVVAPPPAPVTLVQGTQQLSAALRQLKPPPTAEQNQKIQPIISEYAEKISTLSQDSITKTNNLRTEMENKISTMLTDDQRKQLKDNQERRQKMIESRNHSPGSGPDGNRGNRRGGPGTGSFSSPAGPPGMNRGARRGLPPDGQSASMSSTSSNLGSPNPPDASKQLASPTTSRSSPLPADADKPVSQ